MKRILLFTIIATLFTACDSDDGNYITPITENETVTIVAETSTDNANISLSLTAQSATVDWGDGTIEIIETNPSNIEHTYKTHKTYEIKIASNNLQSFALTNEDVTKLSFTNCINLNSLTVAHLPRLTDLDLSNCPNLTNLFALFSPELSSINIEKCKELAYVTIQSTAVTSLNFKSHSKLIRLDCSWNKLKSLDLTDSKALISFKCNNNEIESLIFGEAPNLISVEAIFNKIKILNLSGATDLVSLLAFNNELTSVTLPQSQILSYIHLINNKLEAPAINIMFEKLLPRNKANCSISLQNNPGTVDCDKSIAENKDWDVYL